MQQIKDFFLWCSGANRAILQECRSDENKYFGIGGTIFFTGVLAFFSSAYAIYTVFDQYVTAIIFGLIWGAMIFNLDRYIVSSMKSRGSWWRDAVVAFPRLLLAVLLALVISRPLELKIFEKEINAELLVMEQEVYKAQEDTIKARFVDQRMAAQEAIVLLQSEVVVKTAHRDSLDRMALQEADGTGGSGVRNLGPIYRAKLAEADQADAELAEVNARILPLVAEQRATIARIDSTEAATIAGLKRTAYGGLAARMDALHRLGQGSEAIYWASIFIMLLFVAVETAPIFVKLISSRSPYDFRLHQHEFHYEIAHREETSLLNTATRHRVKFATETGVYRTQQEIAAERELIDHRVAQRLAALKQRPADAANDSVFSEHYPLGVK